MLARVHRGRLHKCKFTKGYGNAKGVRADKFTKGYGNTKGARADKSTKGYGNAKGARSADDYTK